MSLQGIIRWFLPKEDHFYDFIETHGRLAHEAATLMLGLKTKPALEVAEAVQKVEHQADDVVRRMEDALARTFVTPIDREDLHRLTSELDDVVDFCNITARAFNLYAIDKPTQPMLLLIDKLEQVTKMLKEITPLLRKHAYAELLERCRDIRKAEKEADTIYRAAMSALFREEKMEARDFYKQREALDSLERAVDHCDNVADVLSNLAVKHG
jgi:uncharacterized protein Yka (UPF0111/DUF47 family)